MKLPDNVLSRIKELAFQADIAKLAFEIYIAGVIDALGIPREMVEKIDFTTGEVVLKEGDKQ